MSKVKVGVIGLGIGAHHLKCYEAVEQAEVVALCDVDEAKLKKFASERPRVKTFTDYREMLAMEELQGVSIALPNFLHAPVTIDALRAGKHVLGEKPMAMNTQEALQMKAVAEQEGRIFMMHFNMRFSPVGQTLKPLLDSGMLGDVYHVVTTYTRRNGYPGFGRGLQGLGSWFVQKEKSGGGPLIDLGVHRIDLALWLIGYPRPVAAFGQAYDWMARRKFQGREVNFDCEDFATGMIRFENGCTMYVAASWDGHQRTGGELLLKIYGTDGAIFQDDSGLTLCRVENGVPTTSAIEQLNTSETAQKHFVECIAEGKEPAATAQHGVTVMKILDALYESSETGKEVRID